MIAENSADIRVRLTPRPSTSAGAAPTPASPAAGTSGGGASPTKEIGKAVDEGVNAVKKIFR